MQQKDEIPRKDFIQAIRNFKKSHQGKLKNLLQTNNPEAITTFLGNPVIRGYLGRSSILFRENHPDLHDSTSKDEHNNTDHYELKIYRCLPRTIPFRDQLITQSAFYDCGASDHTDRALLRILQADNKASRIVSIDVDQLDEVSASIAREDIIPSDRKILFRLDSLRMHEHATTLLTLFHPITQRVMAVIFLNSQGVEPYNSRLKHYFFTKKAILNHILDRQSVSNFLTNLFSINLEDPLLLTDKTERILVNKDNRTVCVLNSSFSPNGHSTGLKQVPDAQEVTTVIHLSKVSRCHTSIALGIPYNPYVVIEHSLTAPFIDASFLVQPDKDENCSLYSFNFIRAIISMLNTSEMADRILKLGEELYKGNSVAEKELHSIFHGDLKKYLPSYYEPTGVQKSQDQIEKFHLQQRWDIGRRYLSFFATSKEESGAENSNNNTPYFCGGK
jgi:hypothetical protein